MPEKPPDTVEQAKEAPVEQCSTCLWWVNYVREGQPTAKGECRRLPPVPVVSLEIEEREYRPYFSVASRIDYLCPDTAADEFCGEWRAADAEGG